jgi:hypothetical protein
MTQLNRLQTFLDTGQRIHRLTALSELGIFELSARIGELDDIGYKTDKRWIPVINREGKRVKVMEYWKKQIIKEPRTWKAS